jgi:hypothetical protein
MEPCSECGNYSLKPRSHDGATVLECQLCGAIAGTGAAVAQLQAVQEARAAGVDPPVFGLVRALGRLDGLHVDDSDGGDRQRHTLPFVRLVVLDGRGLVQLENLCKSLQLSARSLGLPWLLEVDYRDSLGFVLQPRLGRIAPSDAQVVAAQADLQALQRAVERDVRLSWWRHPMAP